MFQSPCSIIVHEQSSLSRPKNLEGDVTFLSSTTSLTKPSLTTPCRRRSIFLPPQSEGSSADHVRQPCESPQADRAPGCIEDFPPTSNRLKRKDPRVTLKLIILRVLKKIRVFDITKKHRMACGKRFFRIARRVLRGKTWT